MSIVPNRYGGGSLTNKHGLQFEQTVSLNEALINAGFSVYNDGTVSKNGVIVGYSREKHKFRKFLEIQGVNLSVNSDILLPDDAFINNMNKVVYIIEKKYQNGNGSVAEKIQTCEYKKRQYEKLVYQMSFKVEYIYILSDFFRQPKFSDALAFIKSKKCQYFFNSLPLEVLGLDSI